MIHDNEPLYQNNRATVFSRCSYEAESVQKLPSHVKREQWKDEESIPAAQVMVESQYETGYTSGDTSNELDQDHTDYLYRWVNAQLIKACLIYHTV